jgi:Mg-chelatase subunit ChlD
MTGKTYAGGELLFHPRALASAANVTTFNVAATKGDQRAVAPFVRTQEGIWQLKLERAVPRPAARLDVLFLIDATGSMGGEIARLQETIRTISSRIQGLPAQPAVRFGLVSYRDQSEAYVTRKADFTADIDGFQGALGQVKAEGGGDKAEDLEAGLAEAVNGVTWTDDEAVRLVFLVADAAPHIDYPQSTPYTSSMKAAAEKGIKLFPIGCSGLEPEGEYAFRQLAQYTMGQYLFVTRGGDEATGGGGPASATTDKFREGRLDDIVVDLVKSELDRLSL